MSTAIVTGAGGDIGRAIAKSLLQAGHAVLFADIRPEAAATSAEEFKGLGKVGSIGAEVTKAADAAKMVAAAKELGPVSVLVNNAGGITDASLQSASVENLEKDLALNLTAAMICFKAAESELIATKGAMINIASVNGFGVFGHPGYSAAKAGLIHFTKLVAVEYGKHGVRANAVAPGTVETRAWAERAASNPNVMAEARRWYPLQRVAKPEDVAEAVLFLSKAQAITGVTLPVDCGLTSGQTELARTFAQSGDW